MPSRAAVERLRSAQEELARMAQRDLRAYLRMAPLDPAAMHEALTDFLVDLAATYGEAATEVAATWVEENLPVRLPPRLPLGDVAGREQLSRTAGWALRGDLTGDPVALRNSLAARLQGSVQRAVLRPGRQTLERTAHAAGIGYARVPTGSETCAFCLMLASRGPVYSRDSATRTRDGRRYHDACDCQPVPVASEDDYPDGYDPDALYDQYENARANAGGRTNSVLAQMRQDLDVS